MATKCSEECERELEGEREQEKEVCIEPETFSPCKVRLWNYRNVLSAKCVKECVCDEVLFEKFQEKLPFKTIHWRHENLYMTQNFWHTIENGNGGAKCLRLIDSMLVFKESSEVLLLSDYDADRILPLITKSTSTCSVEYMNYSYIRDGCFIGDRQAEKVIDMKMNILIQLYNGETDFEHVDDESKKLLPTKILKTQESRSDARGICDIGGKVEDLPLSYLDSICKETSMYY